jgi:hypothetical protein
MGTRREGCYTDDSERYEMGGAGNGSFFYRAPYGGPKVLSKGGLGQYVYWPGISSGIFLYLIGFVAFFLSQHSERYFCLGSGNLGSEVLGKLIQDKS